MSDPISQEEYSTDDLALQYKHTTNIYKYMTILLFFALILMNLIVYSLIQSYSKSSELSSQEIANLNIILTSTNQLIEQLDMLSNVDVNHTQIQEEGFDKGKEVGLIFQLEKQKIGQDKYEEGYSAGNGDGKLAGLVEGLGHYYREIQKNSQDPHELSPLIFRDKFHHKSAYRNLPQLYQKLQYHTFLVANSDWIYQSYLDYSVNKQKMQIRYTDNIYDNQRLVYTQALEYFYKESQLKDQTTFINTILQKRPQIITFYWHSIEEFKGSQKKINKIVQIFDSKRYRYNEQMSVTMRRYVGKVCMIFFNPYDKFDNKIYPYSSSIKEYGMVAHLGIVIDRDVYHLREWIIYHKELGIHRFFIYQRAPQTEDTIIKLKNTNKSSSIFHEILEQFSQQIIHIPWSQASGNKPADMVTDYLQYYSDLSKFTFVGNINQLLVIPSNVDAIVEKLGQQKGRVWGLKGYKFVNRFCVRSKLVDIHLKMREQETPTLSNSYVISSKIDPSMVREYKESPAKTTEQMYVNEFSVLHPKLAIFQNVEPSENARQLRESVVEKCGHQCQPDYQVQEEQLFAALCPH